MIILLCKAIYVGGMVVNDLDMRFSTMTYLVRIDQGQVRSFNKGKY